MNIPHWIGALAYWIAGLTFAVLVGLFMGGCASDPYWKRDARPVEERMIAEVDDVVCNGHGAYTGTKIEGCADRDFGIITLRRGLTESERACVLRHERAHLKGWNHDDRPAYALDCGPE